MRRKIKLMVVGFDGGPHIGGSFNKAALAEGLNSRLFDIAPAFESSLATRIWRRVSRKQSHVRGEASSALLLERVEESRPNVILTTGFTPLLPECLEVMRRKGIRLLNFSTDDPWSPVFREKWFLDSLSQFDEVFTPRHANEADLRALGIKAVRFLPFGYDEFLYSDPRPFHSDHEDGADVLFVGGGDQDRVPFIKALMESGFSTAVYGGYWRRLLGPRRAFRGIAAPSEIQNQTRRAKVSICLVRRSNRDEHVMRTYEIPASGGCLVAERTSDHMSLFGAEGEAALYFSTPVEMTNGVRQLLAQPELRLKLRRRACAIVRDGENTYRHRLRTLLDLPNHTG